MKIRIITKRWYTPPWGKPDGITLYPFIFVRRGTSKTLLRHELIHVWQVQDIGWWRFYIQYVISKNFRTQMEAMAYHGQDNPNLIPYNLESLIHTTLVGELHK